MPLRIFPFLGILGFLQPVVLNAAHTIHWSADAVSEFYDSGAGGLPAPWTISIGTFGALGDVFAPDLSNTSEWAANWVELDSTNYDTSNPPFYTFQSSVVVVDLARANEQVYMWAYNNQLADETSEWALVSSADWTMATTLELAAGQSGPIDEWVLQTGDTAVWGRLNRRLPDSSRVVLEGGGVRFVDAPPTFDLQTQRLVNPVPEPTVICSLVGAAALLLRRKRAGTA